MMYDVSACRGGASRSAKRRVSVAIIYLRPIVFSQASGIRGRSTVVLWFSDERVYCFWGAWR